jgi:hypothetical protein
LPIVCRVKVDHGCTRAAVAHARHELRKFAPAHRSPHAQAKASYQHDPAGRPYRNFRGLLEHLATLTRNEVRFAGATTTVPMLTEPTRT